MIDLMGDMDLDLLVLPVVVTMLALGKAIEASLDWFTRGAPRSSRGVAVESRRPNLAA